jgi:hypothetical protein
MVRKTKKMMVMITSDKRPDVAKRVSQLCQGLVFVTNGLASQNMVDDHLKLSLVFSYPVFRYFRLPYCSLSQNYNKKVLC